MTADATSFLLLPNKTFLPRKVSKMSLAVAPTAGQSANNVTAAKFPDQVFVPNHGKCMMSPAQLAANPHRFPFGPAVTVPSSVVTAIPGKTVGINCFLANRPLHLYVEGLSTNRIRLKLKEGAI